MSLHVDGALLLAFLLALVRAAGWVATSPPFTTSGVPAMAKLGISAGLAIGVVGHLGGHVAGLAVPATTVGFMVAVVEQAVTGLVLGFSTALLFSAISVAGGLLDLATGLQLSAALDPLSLEQQPVIGRFFNLVATTLLFSSGGYLLLVEGFLTSFRGVPLAGLHFSSVSGVLVDEIGVMLLAALELAAPLLVVLFLTDVLMGLLARAAPQLNVFALSLSVKVMVGVLLVGIAIPLLPGAASNLVGQALRNGVGLTGR